MSTNKTLGRLQGLGIAKEVTRGTTPANAAFFIPFSDVAIEEKDTKVLQDQAFGVIEDSTGMDIAKQWAEGNWKGPITDQHFILVLLSILGNISSATNVDVSGVVYDHTLTVAENVQHQSLSLYLKDSAATGNAQDYTHALAVVHSLEIDYTAGKYIDYTANVKAKKGVQTAVTAVANTENRYLPQHVAIKLASTLAGLDAASVINVKSLKLKFDQKTEDDAVLGNIGPNDYLNKDFMIEGTVEATWDSEASFKTAALDGTTQAMRIDIKNTNVTIGTAAHPEIKIDLAKVTFKAITRPWKVGDIVRQTVELKAHYSATDTKMISVVATNKTASY